MVKVEGISVEELHERLKRKKIERLVKEVFGENFAVDESIGNLYIRKRKKSNLWEILSMSFPKFFLNIFPDKNKFNLKDKRYFDKTYELAEKYELLFEIEPTIKTDYRKDS